MAKSPGLIVLLVRMIDEGMSLRCETFVERRPTGDVHRPREGDSLRVDTVDPGRDGPRIRGISRATVAKAMDDGYLLVGEPVAGMSGRRVAISDAGHELVREWRWITVENGGEGYAVMRPQTCGLPVETHGPVLPILSRVDARYYVDVSGLDENRHDARVRDRHRKPYVRASDVLDVVPHPALAGLAPPVATSPAGHRAVAETYAAEAREVDALPEVREIRRRWEAERIRLREATGRNVAPKRASAMPPAGAS